MLLPIVSISCITYNHAPYIRQCLDGFLMQKTSFPIEILIHDDASTDGTQDIIREYEVRYPEIIKPIYQKENQYSKGVKVSLKYNYPRAKGKYIALCEGDDYWTDPLKLQKQVDFLESHPDYVMCSHQYRTYNQEEKTFGSCHFGTSQPIEYNLKTLIDGFWFFHPLTVVFRTAALELEEYQRYPVVMDAVLFYALLKKGKGYCFPDDMGVYRVQNKGVWSGISQKKQFKNELLARIGIHKVEKTDESARCLLIKILYTPNRSYLLKHFTIIVYAAYLLFCHYGCMGILEIFRKKDKG